MSFTNTNLAFSSMKRFQKLGKHYYFINFTEEANVQVEELLELDSEQITLLSEEIARGYYILLTTIDALV